jgi:hypothetical protein
VDLFRRILTDAEFVRGEFHTRWLDEWLSKRATQVQNALPAGQDLAVRDGALAGALAWHMGRSEKKNSGGPEANGSDPAESRWKREGRRDQVERIPER